MGSGHSQQVDQLLESWKLSIWAARLAETTRSPRRAVHLIAKRAQQHSFALAGGSVTGQVTN